MSEEEILKRLESIRVCGSKNYLYNFESATIINLIKEKQNKIDELKEHLVKRIRYTQDLEKDLFENCSNYVVPKDVIREKIEEYKEKFLTYYDEDRRWCDREVIDCIEEIERRILGEEGYKMSNNLDYLREQIKEKDLEEKVDMILNLLIDLMEKIGE